MTMRNRGVVGGTFEQTKHTQERNSNDDKKKTPNDDDNSKERKGSRHIQTTVVIRLVQGCLLSVLVYYGLLSTGISSPFQTVDEQTVNSSSSSSSILGQITTAASTITSSVAGGRQNLRSNKKKDSKRPRRFPKYGTKEFEQQCNWTIPAPDSPDPECAYLARPPVRSHEGVSDWASDVAKSYLLARQIGCKVYVDYGENIDIHSVVTIFPDIHPLHNWTTPSDFHCNNCENALRTLHGWNSTKMVGRPNAVDAPKYRYSMGGLGRRNNEIYEDDYSNLKKNLPGFNLETGMACALGNIFNLSPTAAKYEPRLFTDILPALYDEDALVIAVNVRTHRTDALAKKEMRNETAPKERKMKISSYMSFVNKTFCLEQRYLSGLEDPDLDISRVVWIVLSDSPGAKRLFEEEFDGKDANARIPEDKRKWKSKTIPRKVLYTGSRGIHTRPERSPSTQDFAEAFIDWFLIGESDAVVVESLSSFGPTGAMRTHRPLHRTGKGRNNVCDEPIPTLLKREAEPQATKKASDSGKAVTTKTIQQKTEQKEVNPPNDTRKSTTIEQTPKISQSYRFPVYGTPSFKDECSWTDLASYSTEPKCIISFVRPKAMSEGLSWYMSEVATQYIMAKQAGCKFYFSYLELDMSEVIVPHSDHGLGTTVNNWTMPAGFECLEENGCYTFPYFKNHLMSVPFLETDIKIPGRKTLVRVPRYRYAYFILSDKFLYDDMFLDIDKALPGFKVDKGMACALRSLFELSPKASQFEPRLFSNILPKLHDPDSLVISIYIRTMKSDGNKETDEITPLGQKSLDCAISVESEFRSSSQKRIVWMVVSDSPALKSEIVKSYNNTSASSGVMREVLVTGAEGNHTRGFHSNIKSFAESLIDWYLIGEADVAVSTQDSTFGTTAALRSNLPVYEIRKCKQRVLVHERVKKD